MRRGEITQMRKYIQVWLINANNTLQETFINKWSNLLFFTGKVLRLAMSLLLLFIIKQNVSHFAGYTTDQLIVFFLTYQFMDVFAQVIYRGVYLFSHYIRQGDFDFVLSQPINPLFRVLTSRPDINDTIFIIPTTLISIYIVTQLSLTLTLQSVLWFLIMLINSFLIVTAMHILILSTGILITEVDGIIWLYRDLSRFGQFPVSVYMEPLRFILFFLVPIGMMVTIPAEILLNTPPTYSMITATIVGIAFLVLSLKIWDISLKKYSSASS